MTYNNSSEISPRQRQVLALWMQGMTYKTIGDMLHIKPTTVNNALDQCQWRLQLADRAQLRAYALFHGLDRIEQEASA